MHYNATFYIPCKDLHKYLKEVFASIVYIHAYSVYTGYVGSRRIVERE